MNSSTTGNQPGRPKQIGSLLGGMTSGGSLDSNDPEFREAVQCQLSIESEQPQDSETVQRVLARLWLRMTEVYGHKFTSSYGTEPNESWARCLAELNPHQIAQGLSRLTDREDTWPPTAIEFRNLCLNVQSGVQVEQRRNSAAPPKALEFNPPKEYRLEQLAKLRAEHGI